MPAFLPKYKSSLYKEFQSINKQSHRKLIAFFERNQGELVHLDFDHYFDLLTDYADALFESGLYHKYIEVAEDILLSSIQQNIFIYKGKDLYNRTLFRKAAAYYNLHQHSQAEFLLRELIKIDPYDIIALRFYQRVLYKLGHPLLQQSRSIFVMVIFMAASITGLELLIIRPFYADWVPYFETSRNVLFISAISILVLGDLVVRLYLQRKTYLLANRSRNLSK